MRPVRARGAASLGVEWDEIEKLRVMCETVLRFTSGDEVEHGKGEAAAAAERARERHRRAGGTAAKNREQAEAAAAAARRQRSWRSGSARIASAAAARASKGRRRIGSLMEAEAAALKAAVAEAEPLGDEFGGGGGLGGGGGAAAPAEGHGDMALPPLGTKDAMSTSATSGRSSSRVGGGPLPALGVQPQPSQPCRRRGAPVLRRRRNGLFASSIRQPSLEAQNASQSVPTLATNPRPRRAARARAARGRDLKAHQVQRATSMTPDARYTAPPNETTCGPTRLRRRPMTSPGRGGKIRGRRGRG